ncbi:MAG: transcriptional regulator [Clostridiales bacterium]|jgi:predicted transcriptional regulator of viral defense system|nr:transcriptional regulator [Clostridiales bacterium]HOB36337.1 transcriptional regulator [Candidatus Avimonas sp.]HQD37790.1 transcriptional regulator [Candidatus Avimonas sp.]
MVGYTQLVKLNTFTMDDVYKLVGNKKTASSLVLRLSKKGLVRKIRNNLYTCINVADGQPVATKYHIACAINNTAYLSHHSAFEYMGISNQVFYEIYVSSEKRFDHFEFNGIIYKYIPSKISSGVIEPKNTRGIRVTTLERTAVDSIKDFEKIGGLEELLNCIESIPYLNESELIRYLNAYNLQFLYQKVGFILEHYKDQFQLSDEFISYCRNKTGKSTRYLTQDSTKYLNEWRLVVPEYLFQITEQGGTPFV